MQNFKRGLFMLGWITGFFLAFTGACNPQAGENEASRIKTLIKQLGCEDPVERRKAQAALEALGKEAQPDLENAHHSEDAEIRTRAKVLLSHLAQARLEKELHNSVRVINAIQALRTHYAELVEQKEKRWAPEDFAPKGLEWHPFMAELASIEKALCDLPCTLAFRVKWSIDGFCLVGQVSPEGGILKCAMNYGDPEFGAMFGHQRWGLWEKLDNFGQLGITSVSATEKVAAHTEFVLSPPAPGGNPFAAPMDAGVNVKELEGYYDLGALPVPQMGERASPKP